jgi:hypothetical protein
MVFDYGCFDLKLVLLLIRKEEIKVNQKRRKVTSDVEKIPFLHIIFLLGEMVTSRSFKSSSQ